MASQDQISKNMVAQLKALDPSISAEVGTPERRIIDTVAKAIADAQVDLNLLQGAFDIDAKFGTDLDNMLSVFGFGRQMGRRATGYITFSRNEPATSAIIIPTGTNVFTPSGGTGDVSVIFRTTTAVKLEVGETSVVVPIEAVQIGESGNVPAGVITETLGSPVYGITSVTNEYPISGGKDAESDSQLKARFTTAGPYRNLAGTYDQFMSLALSTVSKKATVIGPISKYSEYIQVPSVFDGDGGNGDSSQVHEFTTALSTNINSKYIYENLPNFVINQIGASPYYYNEDYDYILNISPADKNRGDAYRNRATNDPISTNFPTIYQPNVTFANVYIGIDQNKPTNAIAPNDVLLFEYSYMSTASRNDYHQNILNCVDVYVDNEDAKTANVTIPRPGNSVPTYTFNENPNSAFYVDNYRRFGDPASRPISGNVFTPLPNQPIIDLPNQINLTTCSFKKDVHYWLVEEITSLRGTIRARNGIEWSASIRGQKTDDPVDGPYTGEYINLNILSSATLQVDIPSGSDVSTSTVSNEFAVSNYYSDTDTGVDGYNLKGKLTIPTGHKIEKGDVITVAGITSPFDATFNVQNATVVKTGSNYVVYNLNTTTPINVNSPAPAGAKITVKSIKSTTSQPLIKVANAEIFPATGYVLIGSEILSYSSITNGTTFSITERGCFGTKKANILTPSATVTVLIETAESIVNLPLMDYILIDSEVIEYKKPPGASDKLLQLVERGAKGTYVNEHESGSAIKLLFQTIDNEIQIENYQYDENIITLQALLEANKQVTTDVLAHKTKVRYFKPDITVMYSSGANKASVDESIRKALIGYFDSLYFGGIVQLSDILQTVHNVGGVDNVRWSKDILDGNNALTDSSGDARPRLIETNKYGDPIAQPILDLIRIGDGNSSTAYSLYLPKLTTELFTFINPPSDLAAEVISDSGDNDDSYYYVVTALTNNGETTISNEASAANVGDESQIKLTWSASANAVSYRVYRSTVSNAWTSAAELIADIAGVSYTDNLNEDTASVQLPPVNNSATTESYSFNVENTFEIQYGQNEPIEIEFNDLLSQNYDADISYSKDEIVAYGSTYYISIIDDNIDNPPPTSPGEWTEDSTNKIAFSAKLNTHANFVTVSNENNFVFAPTFNNRIIIEYNSLLAKDKLSILNANINQGYGVYNSDFQIGDDELIALPVGMNEATDLSSIITIREKAQNTWNSL